MNRTNLLCGMAVFSAFSGCSSPTIPETSVMPTMDYTQEMNLRRRDASYLGLGEGVKLSQAIRENLKVEALTPERKALIDFMLSHKPSEESRQLCLDHFAKAPECSFLKPRWAEYLFEDVVDEPTEGNDLEVALKTSQRANYAKMTKPAKRKHAKLVDQLVDNLKNGRFEKMDGQLEGDYYRALKKVSDWSELKPIAENSLKSEQCLDSELYTYVALKGEEFFPNDDVLKVSKALYSKADQCAGSAKYVQMARFRLGLLNILQNDCKQAEPVFARLAKMGASDYSTRALYWNAYCAKTASKREEFFASFDELFKTNPLGFHTLSLNNGDSLLVDNISKPIDPIVKTRTTKDAQLNTWISLIEDIDRSKKSSQIYQLLSPIRKNPDYLTNLEPGVRLYLATFAFRAHDNISLFRVLDSVFRTQSEYVVDSTLRLFYPMKYLDFIADHSKTVSPLLIAALIRQESAFQEGARSRVGAMGLMQLMPATARLLDRSVRKKQLANPETNIRLGIQYFEALVNRYKGDVELALASYNAGAEVVDRWQKRYPVKNRLLFLDLIPYAETRNYVALIGRNYYWYSKIYTSQLNSNRVIAKIPETHFRALSNINTNPQ